MQAGSAILDTHAGMVADAAYETTALHNDVDFFGNDQFNASHEGMDVYLYLGEHAIGSQAAPTLRSECLTSVQALREGQYWRVKYSYAGCYTDEPNKVDITHSVYGRKLRLTTYIQ